MRARVLVSLLLLAGCGSSSSDEGPPDARAGDAHIDIPVVDAPTGIDSPVATADAAPAADASTIDARVTPDAAVVPDAAMGVTITGTAIDTRIHDDGETSVPINLSNRTIEVLVPQGEGYTSTTGSGTVAGAFTIAGVTGPPRIVGVGRVYLVTSATNLDFGDELLGRADAVAPAMRATTGFSVDLDNLDTPAATDLIEVYSSNIPFYIQHELGVGATTLVRTYRPDFLIESAKGDRVWITQLATRKSANGPLYRGLTRAYSPTPFSTTNGQINALPAGSMVAAAPTTTLDLDWRRSEFHALRGSVNPSGEVTRHALVVLAMPGRPKVTDADSPDLFHSFTAADADDLDYGQVSFGNPFPSSWELFADERTTVRVRLMAPGANTPADVFGAIFFTDTASAVSGVPIRPPISPPRDPKVAGKDAFTAQTSVGLLPLLSWSAPATGTPSIYIVSIVELTNDNGATTTTNLVNLYTPDTQVRVPPSRLVAGHTYFARIRAVIAPNVSWATAPFKNDHPFSSAEAITSSFTP